MRFASASAGNVPPLKDEHERNADCRGRIRAFLQPGNRLLRGIRHEWILSRSLRPRSPSLPFPHAFPAPLPCRQGRPARRARHSGAAAGAGRSASALRAATGLYAGCVGPALTAPIPSATPPRNPAMLSRTTPSPATQQQVDAAEKRVGEVLEDLEADTQAEVSKITLEDVVDTNPRTGRPEVQKHVDITVEPKAERKWSR